MSIGEEEMRAVQRAMKSGTLSGYRGSWGDWFFGGPEIKALEHEWSKYFGVKHAIAINSATSGLWASCAAIGLKQGDECIVSCYSMTCSASIPLHFGAMPVFADIEPDYFCLDPKSVESKITSNTKAIIAVDLFGQPYDADAINAIAKKHGIMVIEDAAQACGAKYKGKYAGTLGDIGVFSLNVHKHIQCGEGGIVVTDNDDLAMKIRLCMNHSESVVNDMMQQESEDKAMKADWVSLVGLNLRMTELSAAVAREQLKKLSDIIKVYQSYQDCFPVNIRPGCQHAFYKYAMTTPMIYIDPKQFYSKRHYITPLYQLPLFKQLGYDQHQCPTCEEVEENIILAWFREAI